MKTAEELAEKLKNALGDNLRSVILYGSAATEDQTKKFSDINVLVVVHELDLDSLKKVMPVNKKWNKAGNPSPLFFTAERIRQAGDVFPIEFMDLKSSRRVLYGEDFFSDFPIQLDHLRHQLEYELRGRLIQLRQRYMESDGKRAEVQAVMGKAMSSLAVLFKGVLRLLGEDAPRKKVDVLAALSRHVKIDLASLKAIVSLRDKVKEAEREETDYLMSGLLYSVENVIDFVDQQEEK